MTDAQRALLAERITAERIKRFGTKSGAYAAAGINAATWDSIEKGARVRDDRLIAAVRLLWPASGGDWRALTDPEPGPTVSIEQRLAEIEARIEALERAHNKEVSDGRDTAPSTQAGESPASFTTDRRTARTPGGPRTPPRTPTPTPRVAPGTEGRP